MHVCFCCSFLVFQYCAKRLAGKNVSEMTDFVSGGTKNLDSIFSDVKANTNAVLFLLLLLLLSIGGNVGNTIAENYHLLSLLYVLVYVSKVIRAVKFCSNKIIQLLTG